MHGFDLYKTKRELLETGDILEWRSNKLIGRAIRFFTKQNVNHTGGVIIFPFPGCPEQRVWTVEATEKGFMPIPLSIALRGYTGSVYVSKLKKEYDGSRPDLACAVSKFIGKAYDYTALLRQAFGVVKSDNKKFFCSEAWHKSLIAAGLLDENFNKGYVLQPGQFGRTGLYEKHIQIF